MSRWSSWTPGTGPVVRAPKPSIVVWCQHGVDGGKPEFVQRYRYDVSMDRWTATDVGVEGATYVTDSGESTPSSNPPPLFDVDGQWEGSREHFNVRCKLCHRLVAMRADRAQVALSRMADAGLTDIPLAALQRAYDQAPTQPPI